MSALMKNVSIDAISKAYARLGNVHKVGRELGLCGQTVCNRLNNAGISTSDEPEFSEPQIERLKSYYSDTAAADFSLQALADELGKSKANVCRKARRLGLTKQGRAPSAAQLLLMKRPKWVDRQHPRGMAGKNHSEGTRRRLSAAFKQVWATSKAFGIGHMAPDVREKRSERLRMAAINRPASKSYTRAKGGHRGDLGGLYLRSSWEANYARYLNFLMRLGVVASWEYEPETFWFEGIKRGVVSYKPDFKVFYKNDDRPEYIEVKGWEVSKDRVKWRRMKKYHPQVKLVVVGAKAYRSIEKKWASSILNWEGGKK